jgi:levansucrase
MATTRWTRQHLSAIVDDPSTYTPMIRDAAPARMLPGIDFWDLWPVREPDGTVAAPCGAQIWAGLSAAAVGDPDDRHNVARIRLVMPDRGGWTDLGPLFGEGASPGSREWAGCLVLEPGTDRLLAYYTAAGERGELAPTYRQRIMGATATLRCASGRPEITGWSAHQEVLVADGIRYMPAVQATGEPGFIKAFRDPFHFRDPATRRTYLVFTASQQSADTDFNGCIGIAYAPSADPMRWELLDPLVTADAVNNELERPHVVVRNGRYYLFFSTQQRTFHPDASGPTGLYGFVGRTLLGPYQPLNGSGLVLRNPPEEPFQAYSWLVLNDLRTVAFIDFHALHGRRPEDLKADGEAIVRRHFGGTMTPVLRLGVDGDRASIAEIDINLSDS